jgi:hypothetical protein
MNDEIPLDETALSVIHEGRLAIVPTDLNRARVQRAVQTKLAADVPTLHRSWSDRVTWAKWAGAIGVTGAVATGFAYFSRHLPEARVVPTPHSANQNPPSERAAPIAAPAITSVPDAPLVSAAAPSARPALPAVQNSSVRSEQLAEEIELLASANASIRSGEGSRALQLLREFDRRFANAVLKEERAAAGVLALCAAGRQAEAKATADRFAARWPRSPLLPRISSSCASGKQQ